jgi:hypothetical protein
MYNQKNAYLEVAADDEEVKIRDTLSLCLAFYC